MDANGLDSIRPIEYKVDKTGNKFVLLAENDYQLLKEQAGRTQEIEYEKERIEEECRRIQEQNYRFREAIVEAMDLGLYGDSDTGVMAMYDILNEALGDK